MHKPEYQAFLLMNSLPTTALWKCFKAMYPVPNKWGHWNTVFYTSKKWILTLDFLHGLLHIHLNQLISNYILGGTPAKNPTPIPAEREKKEESKPEELEESSHEDNFTSHSATRSSKSESKTNSSTSSMRTTLASKKRRHH